MYAEFPYEAKYRQLAIAAQRGDSEMLLAALGSGAEVNAAEKGESGMTPLMFAAKNGNINCMVLLMQHGADVHLRNKPRWTAAHFAAFHGSVGGMRLLFGSCVDLQSVVDIADTSLSILECATVTGQTDAVSLALACGFGGRPPCWEYESRGIFALLSLGYTL